MLKPENFKTKYSTTYTQIHEESFLEEVSKEDREIFDDSEILTGKNSDNTGHVNKFNNFGSKNKGKKYNTQRSQLDNLLKKIIYNLIEDGDIDKIIQKMTEQAKKGEFKQQQLLIERIFGKMKEEQNINISGEGIKFTFDLGDDKKP